MTAPAAIRPSAERSDILAALDAPENLGAARRTFARRPPWLKDRAGDDRRRARDRWDGGYADAAIAAYRDGRVIQGPAHLTVFDGREVVSRDRCPTAAECLLSRPVTLALDPFLPDCVYGHRPGRSLPGALAVLAAGAAAGLRHFVITDIARNHPSVPFEGALAEASPLLADPAAEHLVRQLYGLGARRHGRLVPIPGVGQGLPHAAVLASVWNMPIDVAGAAEAPVLVRYGDDTAAGFAGVPEAEAYYARHVERCRARGLTLNAKYPWLQDSHAGPVTYCKAEIVLDDGRVRVRPGQRQLERLEQRLRAGLDFVGDARHPEYRRRARRLVQGLATQYQAEVLVPYADLTSLWSRISNWIDEGVVTDEVTNGHPPAPSTEASPQAPVVPVPPTGSRDLSLSREGEARGVAAQGGVASGRFAGSAGAGP